MTDYISFLVFITITAVLNINPVNLAGADPGGGAGGQEPPPPFWGTPKFHKEGKNVARVRAETRRFST